MKQLFLASLLLIALLSQFGTSNILPVNAQTTVNCGDVIEGEFTEYETHEYEISISSGNRLIVVAEVDEAYKDDLDVDLTLFAQGGRNVTEGNSSNIVYMDTLLPETEVYTISVEGIGQFGGRYIVNIACVEGSGNVISNTRYVQPLQCGSIIESQFKDYEYHRYYITFLRGDILNLSAEVAQGYESDLDVDVAVFADNGRDVVSGNSGNSVPVETSLPESGTYLIGIDGIGRYGGNYILYVGCTLADGMVIKPGDAPPVSVGTGTTPVETTNFSGYGFSGVAPVDFSASIEIPVSRGQSQNGAFGSSGSDVFAYTYEANAGETATLTLRRTSSNLSIGVAVINRADNSIVFLAGMPSTGSLTAELQFPSAGAYTIGIFRLDLAPNSVGTSGAFEVRLD